ncbi:Transcription initiation factor TFIID subunit 2 [Phytophthora nicotianae]|uniref:Transcription initiation factor TFIID subunit 2 n=1 Tax=Phytophthora nicotianae TaxID=4792 RepID=A0A0W8CS84_PHYNI|nr:Transcription initiation factor TFIID subunit 2 [Phytophthora nicotianae]
MVATSQVPKLFTPLTLGGKLNQLTLQHRVVMAPLTRLKHGEEGVPPEITATYYGQRATKGGLIIAEATNISPTARGYVGSPGIFNQEQVEGWKRVTDTVKDKGGHMFLQLWHTGRMSHPLSQPNGELPVSSSSNVDVSGTHIYTREGPKPHVQPRALETHEIPLIVQDYKKAAENALAAGFDGVEFHCANAYLQEQFLQDGINDRTDKYGGSMENRARFLFESLDAILEVVDSSRLNEYHLAYVHLIEPRAFELHENPNAATDGSMTRTFRGIYDGVLLSASGYNRELAIKAVESGDTDLVAFGRYFISNPDLVKRLEIDAPLNPYDSKTFYAPGELGYIDQPFLEESDAAKSS